MMQIVIKIDDKDYQSLKDGHISFNVLDVIMNGTPLPKRHGDLIDADELKKEYPHDEDWDYPVNTNSYVVESIDNSHTIIEADNLPNNELENPFNDSRFGG